MTTTGSIKDKRVAFAKLKVILVQDLRSSSRLLTYVGSEEAVCRAQSLLLRAGYTRRNSTMQSRKRTIKSALRQLCTEGLAVEVDKKGPHGAARYRFSAVSKSATGSITAS